MATDITNPSSFSLNSMKPANDEETTALWSQNVADNTGLLYFQNYLACEFVSDIYMAGEQDAGTFRTGTLTYKKQPNHNRLHGTFRGGVFTETFYGGTGILYVNNSEAVRGVFSTGIAAAPEQWGTGFSVDVSGFTNYQDYDISYSLQQVEGGVATKFERYFNLTCSLWGTTV